MKNGKWKVESEKWKVKNEKCVTFVLISFYPKNCTDVARNVSPR
jgi:hypothetical protein